MFLLDNECFWIVPVRAVGDAVKGETELVDFTDKL